MKIIKKNQLAILVIALMLITAGYLNYETSGPTLDTWSEGTEGSLDIAKLRRRRTCKQ